MKFLHPPMDENHQPFDAGDVFETCVSMVRNASLKRHLQSIRAEVQNEAADYDIKAASGQLYFKIPHSQVGAVSGDEMIKVYTQRMVPKKSRGRPTYDRIMSAPEHRKCPLCGIGTVNTLDHYLPKTRFPVFSVTPNNLVPVCEWCQGEKSEYYPTANGSQLLHPYFDDLDNDIWLVAVVIIGIPAGFRYYAAPPAYWSQSVKDRVIAHLKELNLPVLFSSNAGSRLAEIRGRLTKLHQKGGLNAVRTHLLEELDSIAATHKNSWAAAMYRAAIDSDWFCDGGFLGD